MEGLIEIYYEVEDENVKLPEYKNIGDAGLDIYANENIYLKPTETIAVSTGLYLQIPVGYYIQIVPRSGISLNTPIRIPNAPATIDSGYRGEVKVILQNISEKHNYAEYKLSQKGNMSGLYRIEKGDRIAQMILSKFEFCSFVQKNINPTNRGTGFGSSGIK
jgi:dUTP pyrophosphatase